MRGCGLRGKEDSNEGDDSISVFVSSIGEWECFPDGKFLAVAKEG